MTAHDPRVTLTEVLAGHVRLPMMHSQGCTCGWHASLSHPDLHRAHLAERLEEHIDARLAPIRALADEWAVKYGTCGCPTNGGEQLRAALEATEADPSASQDHDWHQPLTHCHCGRVIPCRHHAGADDPLLVCSCGNSFEGDNLCMVSACQWEGVTDIPPGLTTEGGAQ